MKRSFFITAMILSLCAGLPQVHAQEFLAKKIAKPGEPAPDFALNDLQGNPHHLSELKGKTVFIHFWSAKCPFVQRYQDRLLKIAADYGTKEVVVLGIDSNVTESKSEIEEVASERKLNYPILIDPGHQVADEWGAITTPHVFIVDPKGTLVYEGSVDDQGWEETNPVKKNYAREVLDAIQDGQPIPHTVTRTFGCTIKRS